MSVLTAQLRDSELVSIVRHPAYLNRLDDADYVFVIARERAENLLHSLETVGSWRLLCLLGMGGMSNVYLGQHQRRPQLFCAVKLTKDFVMDASDMEADPCAASVLLEWRTYQQIGRSVGVKRKLATDDGPSNAGRPAQQHGQPAAACNGALPVAYGYGFVDVAPHNRRHGWLALELLGWNLHAVATDAKNPLDWTRFYQASQPPVSLTQTLVTSLADAVFSLTNTDWHASLPNLH